LRLLRPPSGDVHASHLSVVSVLASAALLDECAPLVLEQPLPCPPADMGVVAVFAQPGDAAARRYGGQCCLIASPMQSSIEPWAPRAPAVLPMPAGPAPDASESVGYEVGERTLHQLLRSWSRRSSASLCCPHSAPTRVSTATARRKHRCRPCTRRSVDFTSHLLRSIGPRKGTSLG
jgi:hypothetical protein